MPALNIIATQLTVLNSGFSSSRPSGIRPWRLNASQSANRTKQVAEMMNNQPRLLTTQFRIVDMVDSKLSGQIRPQPRMSDHARRRHTEHDRVGDRAAGMQRAFGVGFAVIGRGRHEK